MTRGILYAVLSIFASAASAILTKAALLSIDAVQARLVFALLCYVMVVGLMLATERRWSVSQFILAIPAGLFGAAGGLLLFISADYLDVDVFAVLARLTTAFGVLCGVFILREKMSLGQALLTVVAVVSALAFGLSGRSLAEGTILGVSAAVAASMSLAVSNAVKQRLAVGTKYYMLAAHIASVILLIIGLELRGDLSFIQVTGVALVQLLLAGFFLLVVQWSFFASLNSLPLTHLAVLRSLTPLVVVGLGAFFLSITLTGTKIIAGCVMLGSAALIVTRPKWPG